MALNRIDTTVQDVVSDETLVVVEDAKKSKKAGKKAGKKGMNMAVNPGKESSVPASSNAAQVAKVPAQKLK